LRIGIVTRNRNSYSSSQLYDALLKHGISCACFTFPRLIAHVGYKPFVRVDKHDVSELNALIIRPIGRGSLEELVFRMDVLYRLQRAGSYIVNSPEAIEHCVDKYDILTILEENGIPIPKTATTENANEALKAFKELGGDVVIKPLFGSRGVGATRINDPEVATTVFRAITLYHGVIYLQEFVSHGVSDIRAFVLGDRVIAAMKRVANNWKTNYSQGATPQATQLEKPLEDLAVKSAQSIDCKVGGVDILESPAGPVVVEVNSQPGWRGLQTVTNVNIANEIVDFVLSDIRK
jgi:RimK family alpha-L-glutamate ligase